jgi:hypothetical protein
VERREGELEHLPATEYRAGRNLEAAKMAEAKRDAAGAFDARDGLHEAEAEAKRLRDELAQIDQEIDDARQQGKDPEAERFVSQHPGGGCLRRRLRRIPATRALAGAGNRGHRDGRRLLNPEARSIPAVRRPR